MKLNLIIFLLILCSVKILAQNDTIQKPREIKAQRKSESISMISLIANPEKYYGKRVTLSGYLSSEFEGTAIYLSREDFDNRINKNAIFLLIDENNYRIYHKEYVTLTGNFTNGNGHMGLYSGMLKDIEYLRKRN